MTPITDQLLCFFVDKHMFALPLHQVLKVIRAVAVTDVPDANSLFYGFIDMQGDIVPVVNLRQRFSLPPKSMSTSDRFIIADTGMRKMAMVADAVDGVREIAEGDYQEMAMPANDGAEGSGLPKALSIRRLFRNNNGIVVIYDVEELLADAGGVLLEAFDALIRESQA